MLKNIRNLISIKNFNLNKLSSASALSMSVRHQSTNETNFGYERVQYDEKQKKGLRAFLFFHFSKLNTILIVLFVN